MSRVRDIALYILALVVLLSPAILLGWVGLTLLGWVGLILGVIVGLIIFAFSVNKMIAQDAEEDQTLEAGETDSTSAGISNPAESTVESTQPGLSTETMAAEIAPEIVSKEGR